MSSASSIIVQLNAQESLKNVSLNAAQHSAEKKTLLKFNLVKNVRVMSFAHVRIFNPHCFVCYRPDPKVKG